MKISIQNFSIASLLGMGGNSSETGLTSNLVFNQSTAAATLNQMRLFQVLVLEQNIGDFQYGNTDFSPISQRVFR